MDLQLLAVPIFLAATAIIAQKVHQVVRKPFIDELFHLRQAAVYCKHDFFHWDDKITTPPGLYALGAAYHHVLRAFGVPDPCGYTALRSLNLLGGVIVLPAVLSMVRTRNYWRVNVAFLPLLYTYYFLFYTDVWSALLVLASVLAVLRWPTMYGALVSNVLGFTSLWFRQTNIIWIAFAAVVLVDKRKRNYSSFWRSAQLFVIQSLSDWPLLAPYAANGLLFISFVKWNGGITFGDKENHQVSIHLVQVFYCFAFLAFFTLPLWLSVSTLRKYLKYAVSGHSGLNVVATALSFAAINYIIDNFTVVHPFLLADNRHYTFYLYRRILSRKHAKVVLLPVYHFCTWVVFHLLAQTRQVSKLSMSPVVAIAFMGAIIATLVPSPLFEPRYYIVPLLILRIFTSARNVKIHLYEFLWYLFINAVVFIVFFEYEFSWFSEAGVQRIIW